jgi:hypothetical protein
MLPDLTGAAQLCASGNPACWYTALMSLGMTLIRANTLAFDLVWEYEFGIWKRGRAIGILGIYVSNSL